ncbi:predicted protein [Nematostella vectensis]|uniref:SOCS box domain-containing protein n=1 Tax=Nematostella vectensis TaxID=45351 RepID=A7S6Z2_NEMVE|nr:predicted protein [Nematostella vectensis]|eukprot:XP_001632607.1 predicted protein [Nematostella vectensis]
MGDKFLVALLLTFELFAVRVTSINAPIGVRRNDDVMMNMPSVQHLFGTLKTSPREDYDFPRRTVDLHKASRSFGNNLQRLRSKEYMIANLKKNGVFENLLRELYLKNPVIHGKGSSAGFRTITGPERGAVLGSRLAKTMAQPIGSGSKHITEGEKVSGIITGEHTAKENKWLKQKAQHLSREKQIENIKQQLAMERKESKVNHLKLLHGQSLIKKKENTPDKESSLKVSTRKQLVDRFLRELLRRRLKRRQMSRHVGGMLLRRTQPLIKRTGSFKFHIPNGVGEGDFSISKSGLRLSMKLTLEDQATTTAATTSTAAPGNITTPTKGPITSNNTSTPTMSGGRKMPAKEPTTSTTGHSTRSKPTPTTPTIADNTAYLTTGPTTSGDKTTSAIKPTTPTTTEASNLTTELMTPEVTTTPTIESTTQTTPTTGPATGNTTTPTIQPIAADNSTKPPTTTPVSSTIPTTKPAPAQEGLFNICICPASPPTPNGCFLQDGQVMKRVMETHNKYRALHNATAMSLSCDMSRQAQEYAQKMADLDTLVHSGYSERPEQGESVTIVCGKGLDASINDAINKWYNEVCKYDFASGGPQPGANHFTQMVWKGSKKIGIGIAKKSEMTGTCAYVVVRYYPQGNFDPGDGAYTRNVQKGVFKFAFGNMLNLGHSIVELVENAAQMEQAKKLTVPDNLIREIRIPDEIQGDVITSDYNPTSGFFATLSNRGVYLWDPACCKVLANIDNEMVSYAKDLAFVSENIIAVSICIVSLTNPGKIVILIRKDEGFDAYQFCMGDFGLLFSMGIYVTPEKTLVVVGKDGNNSEEIRELFFDWEKVKLVRGELLGESPADDFLEEGEVYLEPDINNYKYICLGESIVFTSEFTWLKEQHLQRARPDVDQPLNATVNSANNSALKKIMRRFVIDYELKCLVKVSGIAYDGDHVIVAFNEDGIALLDTESLWAQEIATDIDPLGQIRLNHLGQLVVSVNENNTNLIKVYDYKPKKCTGSLRELCRMVIRDVMHSDFIRKVKELPIPLPIKMYVLHKAENMAAFEVSGLAT